ncbi:hypothetical protein ABT147_37030 [Streptomyces sp. NPDC001868]
MRRTRRRPHHRNASLVRVNLDGGVLRERGGDIQVLRGHDQRRA